MGFKTVDSPHKSSITQALSMTSNGALLVNGNFGHTARVLVSADISSVTLSNFVDGDTVQIFLIGNGVSSFTADLSVFKIEQTLTAPSAITVNQDSVIEIVATLVGANWWAEYKVRSGGLAAQPTGLAQTAITFSSVALSWTAPTQTGGKPIIDYMLQYKKNADADWLTFTDATSTATTTTVTGLDPSTSYNFRVAALTSNGTGSYSATLTVSTSATPSNPIPLEIHEIDIQTEAGSTFNITIPSVQTGDILIVSGATAKNGVPYSYATSPLPSGTVLVSGGETTNSYDANMFVATRVLNSSHSGTSTTITYSDVGARFAGAWWIIRGANATQPSGTPSLNNAWASSRDAGPVTVVNNSMVIVSCCWRRSTSPTITATPAAYTEIARIDGNQQGAWIGYRTVSAGTENPGILSISDLGSMVISTVGIAPV